MAETSRPVVVAVAPGLDVELHESLTQVLDEHARFRVAPTVPAGSGVVGLLVGPETPLSAADVDGLPDLCVVAATSAGVDHLDVAAVTAAGAWVVNVPDYCTDEVADHALALVLSLVRRLGPGDAAVRAGQWADPSPGPRRIAGTRLGLVGFGRTARALAVRAAALDMQVSAWARDVATVTDPGVRPRARLEDLLGEADVVSLHLPLTATTRGLMDAAALAAMRPDAYLVNVARGELVDETALHHALSTGRLAGAALDVRAAEPPVPSDGLSRRIDVLSTPHIAWSSPAAWHAVHLQAAGSVRSVLRGEAPAGRVAAPAETPGRSPS